MKLTDKKIINLKSQKKRYEVWEGNGFGIRVCPTGKKSWVFMYRFGGKARRLTFGHYPQITLAEAHAVHGKALADLEKGIDPAMIQINANREHRLSETVIELAREYMEKWAKPRKRSWQEDERILKKDIIPLFGKQKAKSITRRDIVLLLDKVLERGSPIAANRTLAVVRRMFNFAIERDILSFSPCYKVKAPSKENRRDRLLTAEEIKTFWNGLENAKMSEMTKIALKLQLTTAQRKGEIVSSEWSEFDFINGWWEIPACKAKNSNLHRVPLSDLALTLLQELKSISGDAQWLFPSPKRTTHIAPEVVDHALKKNLSRLQLDQPDAKPFTPHDLRRTAATYIAAMGISRLVVRKILNHVETSVTAIYDRHSYDKEKKQALDMWSNKLKEIVHGK